MTRFLRKNLTNKDILDRGGEYVGTIVAVDEQEVRNPWRYGRDAETGKIAPLREIVPVIAFADGWEWIPNVSARRVLIAAWGAESDEWLGRRMRIWLERKVRKERTTGRDVEQYEKHVDAISDADEDGT